MIHFIKAYSDRYIDRGYFGKIVSEVQKEDYEAFFFSQAQTAHNFFGTQLNESNYSDIFFCNDWEPFRSKLEVELFKKNDFIFYVLKGEEDYKDCFEEPNKHSIKRDYLLEFGAIGKTYLTKSELESFIDVFAEKTFEYETTQLSNSQDDLEEFGYIIPKNEEDLKTELYYRLGIDQLQHLLPKKNRVKFEFISPEFTKEELNGSITISSEKSRDLLMFINKNHRTLEEKVLKKFKTQTQSTLTELIESKLINEFKVVQCRQSSKLICEYTDEKSLAEMSCFECGRNYIDEVLKKGYSISPLGKKLLNSSHWMTIYVSHELNKQGIEDDSILWNMILEDDEIDLVISVKGRIFVLELKDKDFGAGNAHALHYRRAKFKADKAIIITTNKISINAKSVFKEMETNHSGPDSEQVIPIYIEGIENISSVVNKIIEDINIFELFNKITQIEKMTNCNLKSIIDQKFNISLEYLEEIGLNYL